MSLVTNGDLAMAKTVTIPYTGKTYHTVEADLIGAYEVVVFKTFGEANAKLSSKTLKSTVSGLLIGKDLYEWDDNWEFAALARAGYKVAYLFAPNTADHGEPVLPKVAA